MKLIVQLKEQAQTELSALKRILVKDTVAPYVFILPFVLLLVTFFAYAALRAVYFSFTEYNLFDPPKWIWFDNYISLFREYLFGLALKNSITFAIVVTFTQTCTSLLLAVAMNQAIKGIRFFRAMYYMPSVTSSVVITLIFIWMFQRQGLVNFFVSKFQENVSTIALFIIVLLACQAFLVMREKTTQRPVTALEPSFFVMSLLTAGVVTFVARTIGIVGVRDMEPVRTIWLNTRELVPKFAGKAGTPRPLFAIMMLNIWTTTPTFMLLYLAGLQDIPRSLYEAADIDGASKFQQLLYITVPQLSHITFLVITMGLIGTLQMFDQVAIIGTQSPIGSRITLAYYVYKNAFPDSGASKIGMACAAVIVLAGLTSLVVYIQKRVVGEGRA